MRLFVIARHAHSTLNLEQRVNGNPATDVPLTPRGEEEAQLLGSQLANIPIDRCVHTRFGRTRSTAELALAARDVPLEVEPLLDDIDVGELDGVSIGEYRAWKRAHTRRDRFPGGESLDDAARRYARGLRRLLEESWSSVLVVCHEIPLRYAVNAAAGSSELDAPTRDIGNAIPFFFDDGALARAVDGIERVAARA